MSKLTHKLRIDRQHHRTRGRSATARLHVITRTRYGHQSTRPESETLNPSRGGTAVRIALRCAGCGERFAMIVAEDREDRAGKWPSGSLCAAIEGGTYKAEGRRGCHHRRGQRRWR